MHHPAFLLQPVLLGCLASKCWSVNCVQYGVPCPGTAGKCSTASDARLHACTNRRLQPTVVPGRYVCDPFSCKMNLLSATEPSTCQYDLKVAAAWAC